MKSKRPQRLKKHDRLLCPDARQEEIATHLAVAPLDRLATEMERKWGIDRLPTLVSVETAQRYGIAMSALNTAIAANNPAHAKETSENLMRGLQAMDAEATRAGHEPAKGESWEYDLDGETFAIVKDAAEWQTVRDQRPDVTIVTMREALVAVRHVRRLCPDELFDAFPQAEITKIGPATEPAPRDADVGDFIPF
jgi:hypothetical protein